MKQFFGKKSRSTLATILILSLALHVVAVLIFGTIKLFEKIVREETIFQAGTEAPAQPQEEQPKINIWERNQATPPPRPEMMTVNSPSDLSVPEFDLDVDIETTSVVNRQAGNISGGGIESLRDEANVANLFGKQVEASRLGVILDVSFSTHNVISFVIEEIQRGFPDALIVFAPGCAIDDRDGAIVPISEYEETAEKYPLPQRRVFATKPFVDRLLQKEDFQKIWKRAERKNNGYVVFAELKGHNGNAASHTAMRFLADNGADVIYWFADFNDNLIAEISNKTAGYLRRRDTKLMIHDFVPGLPTGSRLETLQGMADETGGELFLKEFKRN